MRLFSKKGWDKVSTHSVEHVHNKLGADNFAKLTKLLESYDVFENKTFNTSENFTYIFPSLLSKVGVGILANSGDKDNAEFILQMAIALENPESRTSAHSNLAFLYYLEDKKDLAKMEAAIALEIDSKFTEEDSRSLDNALQLEPPTMKKEEYRSILQSIIDGTLNKEDLIGE